MSIWQRLTLRPEKDAAKLQLAKLRSRFGEAVLLFPNDTTVKISGDVEVIKQIVGCLDGLVIDYNDDLLELLPAHPNSEMEK
jgi:hypothetical protein